MVFVNIITRNFTRIRNNHPISSLVRSLSSNYNSSIGLLKYHCAIECLKVARKSRTNPCFCFSDCKMLNTNVECYNTKMCDCKSRCAVLKLPLEIKLDKPV